MERKVRDCYSLQNIIDTPYFLPYGQSIEEHLPAIRTNETGILLWNALIHGADRLEMIHLLATECEATRDEIPEISKDVDDFIAYLDRERILIHPSISEEPVRNCVIGPVSMSLQGPEGLFDNYFIDYELNEDVLDFVPDLQVSCFNRMPYQNINGNILIRNEELIVIENESIYCYIFTSSKVLHELHVHKNRNVATLYYTKSNSTYKEMLDELFHALRFAFIYTASQKDCYVIHSTSVLYENKVYLFTGSSGTGKSTHSNLWNKLFQTPILNGDVNLLGFESSNPICYGIPWCGTSNIHSTEAYPLGGIVFLKQHVENVISIPPDPEKALKVAQRLITPSYNEGQLRQNLDFTTALTKYVPVFTYRCTKEDEAAIKMKAAIDEVIQHQKSLTN